MLCGMIDFTSFNFLCGNILQRCFCEHTQDNEDLMSCFGAFSIFLEQFWQFFFAALVIAFRG